MIQTPPMRSTRKRSAVARSTRANLNIVFIWGQRYCVMSQICRLPWIPQKIGLSWHLCLKPHLILPVVHGCWWWLWWKFCVLRQYVGYRQCFLVDTLLNTVKKTVPDLHVEWREVYCGGLRLEVQFHFSFVLRNGILFDPLTWKRSLSRSWQTSNGYIL